MSETDAFADARDDDAVPEAAGGRGSRRAPEPESKTSEYRVLREARALVYTGAVEEESGEEQTVPMTVLVALGTAESNNGVGAIRAVVAEKYGDPPSKQAEGKYVAVGQRYWNEQPVGVVQPPASLTIGG